MLASIAMIIGCPLFASAEEVVNIPLLLNDQLSYNIRPRMPAAHRLPVCVYADGILTVSFPAPEGTADITVTYEKLRNPD